MSLLLLMAMLANEGDALRAANPAPAPIRIAAASDLRFALEEVLAAFRRDRPSVAIEASYGSSGNLFAQLREGAPFDVFLSADAEYARRLSEQGLSDPPFSYAVGRLALVVRRDSGLDPQGLADLLRSPALRRIAIANPAHAPYGRAAEAALRSWKIYPLVAPRLVLGDSVSQAAQFVDAGAAQAGIVALALARASSATLDFALIPADAHPPLEQAGVIMKSSRHAAEARAFEAFLTGATGRDILLKHGFGLPAR